MIEAVATFQNAHFVLQPDTIKKEMGQYFTGSNVATYMADMLLAANAEVVRILDAGAGSGILTVAAAMRCLAFGSRRTHAVLYEIDEDMLPCLQTNMVRVSDLFKKKGGLFTFDIRHADFVLSRPDKESSGFHVSLINPPYFKYNSCTSPYAGATADLFKGNPNIYASFMAIVTACLVDDGQMIAIVPRSFTNGLYFKGFRQYMAEFATMAKIHIFRARDKVFREQAVLQENVIAHYIKGRPQQMIEVRTSEGRDDLQQSNRKKYPSRLLLDAENDQKIIRIPESAEDARIMEKVENWDSGFLKNGYFISTGRVVEFRTREFIATASVDHNRVPLLRMHNVKPFRSMWTGHHKKDACFRLSAGHEKHTVPNWYYVLLKRFSSKDEKRRLVAGVHDPAIIGGEFIALENHINYIGHREGKLDTSEAYGLAVLFNSTLLDRYFRCISGNTQVNATEVRLLKLPARDIIRQMGIMYQKISAKHPNQQHIDGIVSSFVCHGRGTLV